MPSKRDGGFYEQASLAFLYGGTPDFLAGEQVPYKIDYGELIIAADALYRVARTLLERGVLGQTALHLRLPAPPPTEFPDEIRFANDGKRDRLVIEGGQQLRADCKPCYLPVAQFVLLRYLACQIDVPQNAADIHREVWPGQQFGNPANGIRVLVNKLRRSLDKAGKGLGHPETGAVRSALRSIQPDVATIRPPPSRYFAVSRLRRTYIIR